MNLFLCSMLLHTLLYVFTMVATVFHKYFQNLALFHLTLDQK